MSFYTSHNPCPCESGLEHPFCCGAPDRAELNVIAKITDASCRKVKDLTPEMQEALDQIETSPDLFPVTVNLFDGLVRLVKMSPYWYSESTFLDASRILGTCAIETNLAWLKQNTPAIQWQATPMIFHTAFCGSTLMSKALELTFDTLPVREPDALGSLMVYLQSAQTDANKRLWTDRIMGMLARRYQTESIAVLKANDHSNAMMLPLLAWQPTIPMLFMYTPLREFLVGCLKAESRQIWLRDRYHFIKDKASSVFGLTEDPGISDTCYGKMAAVYWSFNIHSFLQAHRQSPDQLKSLDFNAMLAHPLESVMQCGEWFGLTRLNDVDAKQELKWMLKVYSKDAARSYSSQQRDDEIKSVIRENANEMTIAEQLAREFLAADYPDVSLPGTLLR